MQITTKQIKTIVDQFEMFLKSRLKIDFTQIQTCLMPLKGKLTQTVPDRAQSNLLKKLQKLLDTFSKERVKGSGKESNRFRTYLSSMNQEIDQSFGKTDALESAYHVTQYEEKSVAFKGDINTTRATLSTISEEDENSLEEIASIEREEEVKSESSEDINHLEAMPLNESSDSGMESQSSEKWIEDGSTENPLHHAVSTGDLETVVHLLAQGVEVNSKNHHGQTALHIAAAEGHTTIIMKLLLAGSNPDARDNRQQTSLHEAAYANQDLAAYFLLNYGAYPADPDAQDQYGKTADQVTQSEDIKKSIEGARKRKGSELEGDYEGTEWLGGHPNTLDRYDIKQYQKYRHYSPVFEFGQSNAPSLSSRISTLRIKLYSLLSHAKRGKDIVDQLEPFTQNYINPLQGELILNVVKSYDYALLDGVNRQLRQLGSYLRDNSSVSSSTTEILSLGREITCLLDDAAYVATEDDGYRTSSIARSTLSS